MSNFASRILVAIIGLPLVLGLLWLGGWWLFALVAVAACVAVHEFVTTARQLRPLAPAVYLGVLLALARGRERQGASGCSAGSSATFVLAFLLNAAAETRAPTTAAVGSTVLGSAWIGLGLGSLLVLREMHTEGRLIAFTVVVTVFVADTAAYLVGRRRRPPQARAAPLAEEDVGGTHRRSDRRGLRDVRRVCTTRGATTSPFRSPSCSESRSSQRRSSATSSSRPSSATST